MHGHILNELQLLVWSASIFSSRSQLLDLSIFEYTAGTLQKRIRILQKFGNFLLIDKVKFSNIPAKYV